MPAAWEGSGVCVERRGHLDERQRGTPAPLMTKRRGRRRPRRRPRAESRDPTEESCEIGAADDGSREKEGTPEHQQAEETGSGTEGESSLVTRMDMPGVQRSLTEQMLEPLELRETDAAAQRPGRVEGKQSKRGFFQGIKW